jgi:hypothetical protein
MNWARQVGKNQGAAVLRACTCCSIPPSGLVWHIGAQPSQHPIIPAHCAQPVYLPLRLTCPPQEAELVMFNAVADLLAKTGLKPKQIDVLGEGGSTLGGRSSARRRMCPRTWLWGKDSCPTVRWLCWWPSPLLPEPPCCSAVLGLVADQPLARLPAPAVVNCSLFNPTPSLSAMVINHFGMRSNIESFNLGGC